MAREIKWLTQFAEKEAAKAKLKKEASVKVAQQTIVNKSDFPDVTAGSVVDFENAKYKVVNTDYVDELGNGVILEKLAEGEDAGDEVSMGGGDGTDGTETTAALVEEELPEEPVEAPVAVPGMTKKVTDAPERARNEVIDNYDIEVRDSVEVPKFNEEAVATEQAIAAEDAVDRTSVENHYTWNQNRIVDQMVTDLTGLTAPTEEAPVDAPVDEFAEEDLPDENAVEEVSDEVVEEPTEETVDEHAEEVDEEQTEEDKDVKKVAAKKAGLNKVARNQKLLALAYKFTKSIEAEAEEILEHAEVAVKQYIPARYQKAALTKLESLLETEGIEAAFDKTVSREDLRKTASTKVAAKDLHDTINKIAKAVVAEFETSLEDVDSVAKEVVSKYRPSLRLEVESKLKGVIEKKLASKGIYAKLERAQKK